MAIEAPRDKIAILLQENAVYWAGPVALLLLVIRLFVNPPLFSYNPSWGEFEKIGDERQWGVFLTALLVLNVILFLSARRSWRAAGYALGASLWVAMTGLLFFSNRPGAMWLFALALAISYVASAVDPRSWR